MTSEVRDCIIAEIIQEASEQSSTGNWVITFDEISNRAKKFRQKFKTSDIDLFVHSLYFENEWQMLEYPIINYDDGTIDIMLSTSRLRGMLDSEAFHEEEYIELLNNMERVDKYMKAHPLVYEDDDLIVVNGEYYRVLSDKQAKKIYTDYVVWIVEAGLD